MAKNNCSTELPKTAVDAFNGFLEAFSKRELYIYNDKVEVKKEDLEDTYKEFCDKSREKKGENEKDKDKDKDKKFDEVKDELIKIEDTKKDKIIKIINLAIWLWALPNSRKSRWIKIDGGTGELKDNLLKIPGVAGGGSGYVQYKTNGIRYILYLLKELYPKIGESNDIGKQLLDIILNLSKNGDKKDKYYSEKVKQQKTEYPVPEGVRNLLLHLCKPRDFAPIASTNDKRDIVKAFWECLDSDKKPSSEQDALQHLDATLFNIREKLSELTKNNDQSFKILYEDPILSFWDTSKLSTKADKAGNLPLNTLLKFKKAIVLYGPPGTSKTFSARELAKNIISIDFAEKNKGQSNKYENFFTNASAIFGEKEGNTEQGQGGNSANNAGNSQKEIMSHIHRLQLHPNYTYDDFIAGKTITVNKSKTEIKSQEGYLLKLIRKINDEKSNQEYRDLPHIVILDEINRVDISRVFGELFTAMEPGYREEGVDLPLTDNGGTPLKLKVPENLYFIGTMNLIDFSLEQVDFALRRRFAWVESNYDKDKLNDIIEYKIDKVIDIDEGTISNYVNNCSELNKKISEQSNLGLAYKIGHTFFAEVIDIYKELRGNKNDEEQKKWNSSVEFLWNISIKPMIEAYCGTMDSEAQKNFIEECRKAFCPKPKEEEGQSQTT